LVRDTFLFILLSAYLLGSLPTDALVRRLFRKTGPSMQWEFPGIGEHYREFMLNIVKGMAALFVARLLIGSPVSQALAGLAVIAGHYWPLLFRLQSRFGFGVLIGVLALLAPVTLPVLIVIWISSYLLFQSPFLSHYLTTLALPVVLWQVMRFDLYIAFGTVAAFLVSYQLLGQCTRRTAIRRTAFVLIFSSLLTLGFFSRYVYRGFGVQFDLIRTGSPDFPYVALTFDDGPDPLYTPAILDILAEHNVKATFFLVGRHVEQYPDIARRIADEGHDIGNHTYSHRSLVPLHPDKVFEEIVRAEQLIEEVTGQRPYLFRPPRGVYSQTVRDIAAERQYTICLWSVSSQDWQEISFREVTSRILSYVCNGDILLFHDSGNLVSAQGGYRYNTVRALPLILAGLEEKGITPVSMQELMVIKSLTHVEVIGNL
jgi:peptidoglycan-N-acetylglucosamine deacetylase